MKYILIAIILTGNGQPVGVSPEFESESACHQAIARLQERYPKSSSLICIPKGHSNVQRRGTIVM